MRENAQDFVSFVAKHFRLVEAMCRQHARFSGDDEIIAFLRPYEEEDRSLTRIITRLREVGVLVEIAGQWALPPFLIEFMEKLGERYVLASPKVIQSWVESLGKLVDALFHQINSGDPELGTLDVGTVRERLRDVSEVLHTIVRTVQGNCQRVAVEVSDFRTTREAQLLRIRLGRLIEIHNEFLEPIIRLVDVRGIFFGVTEQICNCCARLALAADGVLGEEARWIGKDVVWLRRAAIRQAEEARRELAPLCAAAIRESKIALGVNRALEAICKGEWFQLGLDKRFSVVDEKDGTLFSDRAVEKIIHSASGAASQVPQILTSLPSVLQLPITPEEVIDKLTLVESVPDLFAWILDAFEEVDLDSTARLFQAILERCPNNTRHSEEMTSYERGRLSVTVARWNWNGGNNGDNGTTTRPSPPTRERVQTA